MGKITTLFIDKGGVLVDNEVVGADFRRLLGEYLPTELGGSEDAWAHANVGAHERAFDRYRRASASGAVGSIRDWFADDARLWLFDMCDQVGVPHPPKMDADRIASAAFAYVLQHVAMQAPRIVEGLRGFRRRGLTLHTASGDSHADVAQYLRTLGIRDLFERVYGSDVVNVWKASPAYYRAILTDAGAEATSAILIDDSEQAIGWAREVGLRGVRVSRDKSRSFEASVVRAFDEVQQALA